jgi:hypothetical protein
MAFEELESVRRKVAKQWRVLEQMLFAARYSRVDHRSDPTENHQNHNNDKSQSDAAAGAITPTPTMRPSWNRTQECQDQDHN